MLSPEEEEAAFYSETPEFCIFPQFAFLSIGPSLEPLHIPQ